MRYDPLFEPISKAEPCGPDLDEEGDVPYLNYMLSAESRFPTRYYDAVNGAVLSQGVADLRGEITATSGLLKRSRDLRVLVVEARFQALAGQLSGFCDCVRTAAGLLERHWTHVHPQAPDGDHTLRWNTLEALDSLSGILPLENASLLTNRRLGPITLRRAMASHVTGRPLPADQQLSDAETREAFAETDARAPIARLHGELAATLAALTSITRVFTERVNFKTAPSFKLLPDTVQRMVDLIEAHRPDLRNETATGEADDETESEDDPPPLNGSKPSLSAPARSPGPPTAATSVRDQAEARTALAAAESYFSRHEASSPVLILVAQARQLIGKPFVFAMQELAPERAARAAIRIDKRAGLQLDMARMQAVTDASVAGTPGEADEASARTFSAASRAEAASLMAGVQAFLRVAEPSSPVPMLLDTARGFLNSDFHAILRALSPDEG